MHLQFLNLNDATTSAQLESGTVSPTGTAVTIPGPTASSLSSSPATNTLSSLLSPRSHSNNANSYLNQRPDSPGPYIEHEQLHVSKRVHGVICLVHCPSSIDLDSAYNEFLAIRDRFPSALRFKCYGFEPLESQVRVG